MSTRQQQGCVLHNLGVRLRIAGSYVAASACKTQRVTNPRTTCACIPVDGRFKHCDVRVSASLTRLDPHPAYDQTSCPLGMAGFCRKMRTVHGSARAEMPPLSCAAGQIFPALSHCVIFCPARGARGTSTPARHPRQQSAAKHRHVCQSIFDDKIEAHTPKSPHPALVNEGLTLF